MLHVTYISSDRGMKSFLGTLDIYSIESYIYTDT
jgi:hypothetical protein